MNAGRIESALFGAESMWPEQYVFRQVDDAAPGRRGKMMGVEIKSGVHFRKKVEVFFQKEIVVAGNGCFKARGRIRFRPKDGNGAGGAPLNTSL